MADKKRNITGAYPGAGGANRPKKKQNPAGSYPGRKPAAPNFKIAGGSATPAPAPIREEPKKVERAPKVKPQKAPKIKAPKAPKERGESKKFITKEFWLKYGKTLAYYSAILVVSVLLASWLCGVGNEVLGLIRPDKEITVTIKKDASLGEIADALEEEGIIEHPTVFKLYCKLKKEGDFQHGEFTLNCKSDYNQLIRALQRDARNRTQVKFTIEAGYTQEDLVTTLCDSLRYFEREELEEVLQKYDYSEDFSFLKNLPDRNYRLEGYLYPDTYEMYEGESAVAVVRRILSRFEEKVLTEKNLEKIEESGYSLDELITLASILQKEGGDTNLAKAAGVYFNRLKDSNYSYLDSQATIAYILPAAHGAVTKADLTVKDPYNTYRNAGLPKGPIANPSAATIAAVLSPKETDDFYFVTREDGRMTFAANGATHKENLKKAGENPRGTGTVG